MYYTPNQLVLELKNQHQDHEFYPTTAEIIARLVADIKSAEHRDYRRFNHLSSVLDIGAGNGKVLRALAEDAGFSSLYAIEKSHLLCKQLPADVFIVGTDFKEQSLLSKNADVVFCNPPFSEFEEWAVRIVREAPSHLVYLVLPSRWEKSVAIADAIRFRDAKVKSIGEFSFEDAEDRAARAKVHLLRIEYPEHEADAFSRFFDEQFSSLRAKFETDKKHDDDEERESWEKKKTARARRFESLVPGEDYPARLVQLYNEEMALVQKNYQLVAQLDVDLLKEFEITPPKIMQCLKDRLAGLRNDYWKELFSKMEEVTNRLTSKKRQKLLDKLQAAGHVDFTPSNIFAVILWVLKNANAYLDEQLIDVFEEMARKANVRRYKSNLRPFVEDNWRYNQERPTHIALEYRIVLNWHGLDCFWGDMRLSESGCEFIRDLLTVARNLGFACSTQDFRLNHRSSGWAPGQPATFFGTVKGKSAPLLEVKAFKNRNLHVRMHQQLALALNVEVGRLKGWLKSGQHAAEELDDAQAPAFFGTNIQLATHNLLPATFQPEIPEAVNL